MTSAMTPEEASTHLFRAADLLLIDGWCQGQLHDSDGAHCMKGAIEAAWCESIGVEWQRFDGRHVNPSEDEWTRFCGGVRPLVAAVSDALGVEYIPTFNDGIATTVDQAVEALKQSAKAVANGEVTLR